MNIFPIPQTLFAGQNIGQLIQNVLRFVCPEQMFDLVDVVEDLLLRNTHQLLNVGAYIFHTEILRVHHQENIIHIDGQLGEQLVTGKQRVIFLLQLLPVLYNHQQQKHNSHSNGNCRDHGYRGGLKLVHTGVDHIGRHNTHNSPVLKIGGLIHQIIGDAVDFEQQRTGIAGQEILL